MALEWAGADFWALQIGKDADCAALLFRGAAQAGDVAGVLSMGAVREIQAGHIHAEAKQITDRGLGIAGGTDGADNLGATAGSNVGVAVERKIDKDGCISSRDVARNEIQLGFRHFARSQVKVYFSGCPLRALSTSLMTK